MADLPGGAPLRLRDAFPPVSTAEWDAAVRRDLKGAEYEKRLVWRTEDGIAVRPFYRAEDLVGLEGQTGAVPGEPPYLRGDARPWRITAAPAWPRDAIRADLLHDAGATTVQEVAWAIAEGVDRLVGAADRIEFVFAVGSAYFVEIAKLRAVRLLWATALTALQPSSPVAAPVRIHVRTARANKGMYDPYTNVLRATTEAMSAAIGGADTVLVEAHGFDPHLAINVQRILAEEAHLDVVADPAGGSYYVEHLTDAIAREAWASFQQIEAAGGHAAAVAAGLLAQQLQVAQAAREKAVSSRRRTLVGVNDYPDLTQKAPAEGPFPRPEGEGVLAPRRLASPFEAMRARTTRHAARTGRTPVVHLLTRGDVATGMARANFCLNFFGCAGFDVTQDDALPATADLIVLCSADTEYVALARDVVAQVAMPVLVAGNPKADEDELIASGVQGFVHTQSDVVQMLTSWQYRLGMAE